MCQNDGLPVCSGHASLESPGEFDHQDRGSQGDRRRDGRMIECTSCCGIHCQHSALPPYWLPPVSPLGIGSAFQLIRQLNCEDTKPKVVHRKSTTRGLFLQDIVLMHSCPTRYARAFLICVWLLGLERRVLDVDWFRCRPERGRQISSAWETIRQGAPGRESLSPATRSPVIRMARIKTGIWFGCRLASRKLHRGSVPDWPRRDLQSEWFLFCLIEYFRRYSSRSVY